MATSFIDHKEHRHHNKSHMMVPCAPFAHLIVGHAAFSFGVLKRPLHPVALKLHLCQGLELNRLGRIGKRYLGLGFSPQNLGAQKKEAAGLARFPVPYVNRKAQRPEFQRPTGGSRSFSTGCSQSFRHSTAALTSMLLASVR